MQQLFGPDTGIIRDSLYSSVPVNPNVLALMATPEFLRLQRVKQLGWVYTVWPGATHTRYEHSLGVYYLARRALESLLRLGADGGLGEGNPAHVRTLLAGSLLHDVGHYPYSHGIEELGAPVVAHEEAGARLIEGENISSVLRSWGVAPEEVVRLIRPGADDPGWMGVYRSLLSGALDVDKLD